MSAETPNPEDNTEDEDNLPERGRISRAENVPEKVTLELGIRDEDIAELEETGTIRCIWGGIIPEPEGVDNVTVELEAKYISSNGGGSDYRIDDTLE